MYAKQNVIITDHACGIRLRNCSELAKNEKKINNDVSIYQHGVIINFFWRFHDFLIKFSDCSMSYVNVITGSGVITIFYCKKLTRNPEIGNTPVWVFANFSRLYQIRDIKFANCQAHTFFGVWITIGELFHSCN